MTHIWQLCGYDKDTERLVTTINLPRVLWPLLSELANVPEPEHLTFMNCGLSPIDEAHARALARSAMDVDLRKNCDWFVEACNGP